MARLIYINDNNESILWRADVTSDEIQEVKIAQNNLNQVMNSIDYYNIVKDNIVELMEAIINYDLKEKKAFASINRYFFNMVNSFYCYVKYYERFFNNKYKPIFSEQFDKYESYKIVSELRKYTTHCFMAVTRATHDIMTDQTFIEIVPEDLLEYDAQSLRADVRKILKSKIEAGKTIDLKMLTGDFLNIFSELQVKIMQQMQCDIFENIEILEKYIYGKNRNKKETYLLTDDGVIMNMTNILLSVVKKFEEEYVMDKGEVDLLKQMHKLW